MTNRVYRDVEVYRRLLKQARPYWPHIAGFFVWDLLGTPLHLLLPLPVKIIVDSVVGNHPLPRFLAAVAPQRVTQSSLGPLLVACALGILITLLVYGQSLAAWLLQSYTGEMLAVDLRARLFHHLQRLSLAYHDRKGTSDSTYRVEYDAAAIQAVIVSGITPFITDTFMLLGTFYVTARIDWELALIALAISPVLWVLLRASRARLSRAWPVVKELSSAAMGVVQEVLSAARVVKAFGREDHEQHRFLKHARRRVRGELHLAVLEGGFDLLVALTLAVGTGLTLFIGVLHIRSGILTLGQLLMVVAYLSELYEPLTSISKKIGELQSSLASADRVFSVFDLPTEVVEKPAAQAIRRARGEVIFRNVSFAYDAGHSVLHDVSFAIPPGARVGISGTTGSGKTTLLNLILRFYDPDQGVILLDGLDLCEYKLKDLRKQFAIVLQDSVLFSTSIEENIAYGRPGASCAEIVKAAKAASAHEFITALPHGYQTQVGERGLCLSGGERQRIALARAFLKDAPVMLLDEPTSALDAETESVIVEATERLMRGRTTLVIAHRPSLLEGCHLRLQLKDGRLVSKPPVCVGVI